MTGPRREVLAAIAERMLTGPDLVAAWAGEPWMPRDRATGVFSGGGSWLLDGDVVHLDQWEGITGTVPVAEFLALAVAVGSQQARDRIAAAIADHPKAMRDAERYIRAHSVNAMVLSAAQQEAPEWLVIRDRLVAVQAATAAWWSGEPPTVRPGEQMDLFAEVAR